MLNQSIHYHLGRLFVDRVDAADIVRSAGTPAYIYSLPRVLSNYKSLASAFSHLDVHVHYSAKANANHTVLRTLANAGAGIDAVSAGEIAVALAAGVHPGNIVFAGVGKTSAELHYAVEHGVGWFNVENTYELDSLNMIASDLGRSVRVALRLNPDVQANTLPGIATGHKGAKFGLSYDAILSALSRQHDYPALLFEGLHVHVGSQLGDTEATVSALKSLSSLLDAYPELKTINIGGGFPANYDAQARPGFREFAQAVTPYLQDFNVIVEPGRSVVADAGILVTQVLYTKNQAGLNIAIVDASMTELIRPALYGAHHHIVPLNEHHGPKETVQIVGPVCETTDILARAVDLPPLKPGDVLAILDAGAYGMVMASNYNQRPRPPEIVVDETGISWRVARRRETIQDLMRYESSLSGE